MNNLEDKLISFQNLLMVAGADGNIQSDEKEILIEIGVEMGLQPEHLKSIVNSENPELKIHNNQEENLADLGDMLTIAASDGIVLTDEYEVCLRFAKMCGISQEQLDDMLQVALSQITDDMEESE